VCVRVMCRDLGGLEHAELAGVGETADRGALYALEGQHLRARSTPSERDGIRAHSGRHGPQYRGIRESRGVPSATRRS
jgi:hypothetical protein